MAEHENKEGLQGKGLPFWKKKTLDQMDKREWESLCDGCGRCCLNKLEFQDTMEIHFTNVVCKLLDSDSCRCKDYPNRKKKVSDCIQLSPKVLESLSCMPDTCAYRLLYEGKDLKWWHPLISGTSQSVHESGISVRSKTISEEHVADEDLDEYIIDWIKPYVPNSES